MLPFTPDTVIFTIGTYRFGTELFFKIIALIIIVPLTSHMLKKKKIFSGTIDSFYFITIVLFSAYLGGRIWNYIQNWHGPGTILDFFNLNNTGTTSFGFFVGAAITALIYVLVMLKKTNKKYLPIKFVRIMDIIAIPAALMVFILRLGCFFDGHVIGKETNLPWCVFKEGICTHPITLYLALSGLLIFFILIIFFTKEKTKKNKFGKRFDGEVALWFLSLYCFNRFWLGFLRDAKDMFLSLNSAQWVCLAIILGGYMALKGAYIYLKDNNNKSYEGCCNMQAQPYKIFLPKYYIKDLRKRL